MHHYLLLFVSLFLYSFDLSTRFIPSSLPFSIQISFFFYSLRSSKEKKKIHPNKWGIKIDLVRIRRTHAIEHFFFLFKFFSYFEKWKKKKVFLLVKLSFKCSTNSVSCLLKSWKPIAKTKRKTKNREEIYPQTGEQIEKRMIILIIAFKMFHIKCLLFVCE